MSSAKDFSDAASAASAAATRSLTPVNRAALACASALQRLLLGGEPVERRLGIGRQRMLARKVGRKLLEPAVELADPFLGAGLLALERFARGEQALQRRGGLGLRLAQRRQTGGGVGLARGRLRVLAGARGNDADGLVLGPLRVAELGLGADPAQVEQQRFGPAHLTGNIAVAHRLPRLGLERGDLRGKLADDVLDPYQIVLGGLQPQLRLVTARMQSGNAGSLFEDAAALVGPRLDDLADAALMHQRRRPRTGRGVGEQHGDVARAHLAAIDAEDRALLAHDAARDFERVGIVERRGRRAVAVVDHDGDFGMVARRTLCVAGEDDVVHLRGAHGLVGGFAHDPAHGLDQVRLAAAIRTDHTGQSGFDLKVGGFDKGLEADQAQPRELHSRSTSIFRAAAVKGITKGSRPFLGASKVAASARRMNLRARERNSAAALSRFLRREAPARGRDPGAPAHLGEVKKPLSLLEIGVDDLGQRVDRLIAGELLAVDEEGRYGIDPELLGGAVAHFLDAVEHMLIRQALHRKIVR